MFHAAALHAIGEFLLVFHELNLHVHLAAGILNLTQEKQVFDEGEDARRGILFWSGQRLRIKHGIGSRKPRPSRSSAAIAVVAALIGAIAVIHGSGKNALLLLAWAAHGAARTAALW